MWGYIQGVAGKRTNISTFREHMLIVLWFCLWIRKPLGFLLTVNIWEGSMVYWVESGSLSFWQTFIRTYYVSGSIDRWMLHTGTLPHQKVTAWWRKLQIYATEYLEQSVSGSKGCGCLRGEAVERWWPMSWVLKAGRYLPYWCVCMCVCVRERARLGKDVVFWYLFTLLLTFLGLTFQSGKGRRSRHH